MYDYDAKSRRDELIDIIVKTLKITTRALRPDVSILVGAFPESEWNCIFSYRVTRLRGRLVLKLPSWFPGMSFKREMATAKEYSKQYVAKPFKHTLQRLVRVNLGTSRHKLTVV